MKARLDILWVLKYHFDYSIGTELLLKPSQTSILTSNPLTAQISFPVAFQENEAPMLKLAQSCTVCCNIPSAWQLILFDVSMALHVNDDMKDVNSSTFNSWVSIGISSPESTLREIAINCRRTPFQIRIKGFHEWICKIPKKKWMCKIPKKSPNAAKIRKKSSAAIRYGAKAIH